MTGPEHYREAERHLSAASFTDRPGGRPAHPDASHHIAMAQAHATLALAAATAMSGREEGMHQVDFEAWDKAAGVPLSGGDAG
ncbi:hypothetical protein [Streptomyces sp. CC208A]|uniref:hypothetical protein n=1 Tax=Streptomyces sp. CC208A TaxID=3044573 RepID=UPI0024A957ED|nr:hypothetical protein [Streptomyces sp. CC208A]